jgi:tRNA (adenine57-N1/adenine58-N1)-methyltransferase
LGCNHRTEILYLSDISMILANLGVKPGSLVIETGTGTGSLSTAFITALQPYGRLYTFEYHDARAAGAAQDFERNGLTPWVTVTHRDTIRTGFPAELDGVIDAVFLDLPAPWEVVPAAKKALKHDAPFCSFSPCIEQIQATAEKLAECGFVKIETVECLQKAYDVRTMPIQKDLDDWSIESPLNPFPSVNTKKRQRVDPESTEKDMSKEAVEAVEATSSKQIREPLIRSVSRNRNIEEGEEEMFKLVSRPFPEMRGHTGYLIFARNYSLAPLAPRSVSAPPVASSSMDSMP